jgi:hypothetical protein
MMDVEPISFDRLKQQRLYDNFIDDIFTLKKYLDDPAVTDIFTTGTGEIIVKRFAEGKVFTGETRCRHQKCGASFSPQPLCWTSR